jgi:hypothetical protein
MSRASSPRPQKREVTVMFEPTRLESEVLQAAYGWVAPVSRRPLRSSRSPSLEDTKARHDTQERSVQ